MYRYLLFFYQYYYPRGGMEDCVLKTNDYDELVPFIHEHYYKNWYFGTITYYDTIEDKHWEAIMEPCEKDIAYGPYKFSFWEEKLTNV